MENIFKKIFSGRIDDFVHDEFIKFSRGVFENRYLIDGKKQKDKWSIKTSAEFANYFVRRCLEGEGELEVSGVIVCTKDLRNEILFQIEKVKQFAGVKQYVIKTKLKAPEILSLMNKYPRAFYALSFSTHKNILKIKAKSPKSGKPSQKGEKEAKIDFCSLKTSDENLVKDLFFDFPNFKQIVIKHTIKIDSIELPKGLDDPVKIRESAKKKGKIIRKIDIDGLTEAKEIDFEA